MKMNFITRLKKRRRSKQRIKDYQKGVDDTNNIRDTQDEARDKSFKYELEKKEKEIQKLKNIITENHQRNCELQKDLFVLREQLTKIEHFVETKQIEINVDAIRKLTAINIAEAKIRKIEKKLPDLEKIT